MTIRLVDEARAALDAGTEFLLPVWFSDGPMAHRSPIRTVREHFSRTPAQMAQAAGITEGQLARFESSKALPPAAILDANLADVDIDPRILRRMYDEPDA